MKKRRREGVKACEGRLSSFPLPVILDDIYSTLSEYIRLMHTHIDTHIDKYSYRHARTVNVRSLQNQFHARFFG